MMSSHRRLRSPSAASEGEIIESGPHTDAIQPHSTALKDSNVDRLTRHHQSPPRHRRRRSPSVSRTRYARSPSRSPYRAPREKRRYAGGHGYDDEDSDDARYGRRLAKYSRTDSYHSDRRDRGGERRHGSDRDYERRPRVAYHDYDDYGHGNRHTRTERGRSPLPDPRRPKRYVDDDEAEPPAVPPLPISDHAARRRENGTQARRSSPPPRHTGGMSIAIREARTTNTHRLPGATNAAPATAEHRTQVADTPQDAVQTASQPEAELDEAALIEQRRRKREEILAKFRQQQEPPRATASPTGQPVQVPARVSLSAEVGSTATSPAATNAESTIASHTGPGLESVPTTPLALDLSRDDLLANTDHKPGAHEPEGASAVDYNPTVDVEEDKLKHDKRYDGSELPSQVYDETKTVKQTLVTSKPHGQPPKLAETFDMFADDGNDGDADDMFADTPPDKAGAEPTQRPGGQELDVSMMDNWDDPQGYYNVMLGELFSGRYHVTQNLGRGMFSAVVRAIDSHDNKPVAIKIIRNNETMRKAGMKEIEILQQLRAADPDDRKHVVRFLRHFIHKDHLCIVFENLSMNLREVLRKFGRDVGINLRAIRVYAQQMFLGLTLLRKCGILHADLKPDNLLVNEGRNVLKICDLGSASSTADNEITPYLVSRFYRAPEIILGLPYDYAIDMWSIGCTLYELYTGKILFTGRTNNQMLRVMMECRGAFPPKLLRKGALTYNHFDEHLNFRSVEEDKLTGRVSTKVMTFKKPTKDLKTRLMGKETSRMNDADAREIALFVDLLDMCLNLNPAKRCTPLEALKHPFIHRGP